jgi:hypothetical protein
MGSNDALDFVGFRQPAIVMANIREFRGTRQQTLGFTVAKPHTAYEFCNRQQPAFKSRS